MKKIVELYKYFELYQKQGQTALFVRLIEERLKVYDEAALEYLISSINDELRWRVGPKAEYLQAFLLIAIRLLLMKRHSKGDEA